MADYDQMIADAEKKLAIAQQKIDEIERLKAMESGIRKEIAALTAQIEEWKGERAFYKQGAREDEDSEFQKVESKKPAPKKKASAEAVAASASPTPAAKSPAAPLKREELFKSAKEQKEDERKKRLKALTKKIEQIKKLKLKDPSELDADAREKVASEPKILAEMRCLENGEEYVPDDAAPEAAAAPKMNGTAPHPEPEPSNKEVISLPTDAAEVEKAKKALRKKLKQIEELKGKGNLDPDAKAKVASESRLSQELEALERGDSEFVYDPPPEADPKIEAEKRLKAVKKKLEMIAKLKEGGKELDADQKAKVSAEAELKKERHALEMEISEINKKERERVAERLGWDDVNAGKNGKK
eukprot:gnl/TRDRNA2_/TRDRNA2_187567_c0_seq1.p1 gnl/TRDRNA2_/TRDRNA2_187567_c0~~gnl/TRDRNA2_/TRDRNA2_187567_c0_seq1.p1  ORF type:complete len:367 (+),score=143.23 gnl/TRDRNA2_/TRDRNA2_187567_c0_seq1:33-1103(+)